MWIKKLATIFRKTLAPRPAEAVEIPHCRKREPGNACGYLALAEGPRVTRRPGNWLTCYFAARQGPLHLIHGGGLVLFCPGSELWRLRLGPIPAGKLPPFPASAITRRPARSQ